MYIKMTHNHEKRDYGIGFKDPKKFLLKSLNK